MRLTTLFLTILLLIALPACQPQATATSTAPANLVVPAGGKIRITVEPIQGTPELDPRLTLRINLVDGQTGQPVRGNVLLGDEGCQGEIIHRAVSQFTVELPAQAKEPICLCILAAGYETWSQGYRYQLEHSRVVSFTVELSGE